MKWAGMVSNASPHEIPPGAAVTQVNLQVLCPGKLTCRPGNTTVTFATVSASTSRVIAAFRYPQATDSVVYQDSSGKLFVARSPS